MTVICQRCWKTGHNVHDVSPIEGKQNLLVREAQEKETTIKLVEQIIDQHEMHAQEQMDSLEARKEEYLEKLQDQFSEIVSALQQHVENLTENAERDVDQLQTLYQNDLSAYSEFRAKLSLPPIYSQDIQSLIEHNDFLNSVVSRSDHLRIPPRQIPNLQATFNQAAIGNLLQAGVSRAPQSYVKNKYEQVGVEYTHVNFESAIIPVEQQTREVFSVLPLFSGAECLYRMSGSGTGNDIFHRCVDGQGPFFILISTANGNIFGAYCEIPLESQGKWKTTDKAWLYTIRQGEQWTCVKLTINPKRANYAVCHDKNFAVMFGSGKDLHLNLNNLSDCRSTVASTYCIPKGMKTSPDRVLAGSYYKWDITEIEVFRVQLCDSLPSRPLLEKRVTEGKRDAVPAILVAKNIMKMWRDFEPNIGIYVPDLVHVVPLPSNSIQSIIDGYETIVVLVETEDITGGCNHTLGIVKRTEVTSPCIFLADYDDLIVHWDMGDFEFAADDDSLVCRKVGGEASLIWPERFEIEIVGNELQLGGLDLKFDRFRASIMTN